jgi:hypothetical protein
MPVTTGRFLTCRKVDREDILKYMIQSKPWKIILPSAEMYAVSHWFQCTKALMALIFLSVAWTWGRTVIIPQFSTVFNKLSFFLGSFPHLVTKLHTYDVFSWWHFEKNHWCALFISVVFYSRTKGGGGTGQKRATEFRESVKLCLVILWLSHDFNRRWYV